MPTYQADAIVLRRLDYGEADRILTLLTREHGKLSAIARGARKSQARAGALDLFGRSRMMLAKGHNLDVVAQVERRGDARNISGDMHRTAYACLVAEVVDKVLEDRHPVDDVFDLVVETLDRLNAPARLPRADAAWFLMRILDLLGYQPQLQACAGCGSPLSSPSPSTGEQAFSQRLLRGSAGGILDPGQGGSAQAPSPSPLMGEGRGGGAAENRIWFSPLLGGVLCEACGAHAQAGSELSLTALKVLRVMQAGDGALYDRLRLPSELLAEVERGLEDLLEYHLDRHLKSLDFLRGLRG